MKQRFIVFHQDASLPDGGKHLNPAPTIQQARWQVDNENSQSPFNKMVGQFPAKKKLQRAAINALLRHDHLCRDVKWLLTGPSSVGKTTLAKIFAEVLELPFIEISPKAIGSLTDVFIKIQETLASWPIPLQLVPHKRPNNYLLPPCIIFVDEVHALKDSIQHGLLKATENADNMLHTESGEIINCYNVCWMIATTDSGDLFDAFDNRFLEVNLKPYTKHEIALIVQKHFPEWPIDVCEVVAHYQSRIPRKALEFAREMNMEKQQGNRASLKTIAKQIAEENGIDKYGMGERHLKILRLLGEGPISKDRMALCLNVKVKELDRRIMPPLLIETEDMPALVTVTKSGFALTKSGVEELQKRGLACDYVVDFRAAE